jgi:hypothetical protein
MRTDLVLLRRPIDKPGRYYDEARAIVMRRGLLLEEERRYLWHELEHADRRDTSGHNDAAVERLVERRAAETAMPWGSILWAWAQAQDLTEMAGLLKLPEEWVHFRLTGLHPAQKALLRVRADQYA